jgi:hypothetical protein
MGFGGQGIRNNTLAFSLSGSEVIDDTAAHTGEWGCIQVINTAVIASITMPNVTNSAGYTGITIDPGTLIYGDVQAITLTSGVVTAHNI